MNTLKAMAIATSVLFFLQSAANAETLNTEQIQSVMIGKRIDWVTLDGKTKGFSMYKRTGSSDVTITAPDRLKDTGTWRIVGNKFCSTWKKIRNGKEGCSTLRTTNKEGLYQMDTVFLRSN